MRKTFLIIAFIVSIQTVNAQRFNAYFSAGVAASQVSGDELGGFDKAGLAAAAGVVTPISRKAGMGMEIGFLQKGSRKPSRLDQGDPVQYRLRLNYVEIPVYVTFSLNRKLALFAGPSIGVLISSMEENEDGELSLSLPFKRFDAGITGGLAYRLAEHWNAVFKGVQSVMPVREFGGSALPFFDGGQYNSVVVLSLGYYFNEIEQ